MARGLNPDERALWARVADGIAADAKRPRHRAEAQLHPEPLPVPRGTKVGATLDGAWDRRLRLGEVVPDRTIDLHGLTLNAAHVRVLRELESAVRAGARLIVLVTGKPPPPGASRLDAPLRGVIRASVGDWIAASPLAGRIAAIRPAHVRHGGAGAVYIVLRRPKHP